MHNIQAVSALHEPCGLVECQLYFIVHFQYTKMYIRLHQQTRDACDLLYVFMSNMMMTMMMMML